MTDAIDRARDAQAAVDELGAGPPRLRSRVDELAELVCVLYGWSPAHSDTDRDKATHQIWREWREARGDYTREDYPELSEERIAELAAERDEIVGQTLGRLATMVSLEAGRSR